MASLIYIADPMCSWCYGFGPELLKVLNGLPDTPLEIIVGGLRPYNTQIMDDVLRATLLAHWQQVREASGLPLSDEGLSRDKFIYNTEPACRAVVAARIMAPHLSSIAALEVFHTIQQAFYAKGHDVTQGDVLAAVTSVALTNVGYTMDAKTFYRTWAAADTITATHTDFVQVQHWGVSGFPTLLLERNGTLDFVMSGYIRAEKLVERLQAVIDREA